MSEPTLQAKVDPARHAADVLQQLFQSDPEGCQKFLGNRTAVELKGPDTLPVEFVKRGDKITLGPLGLLNGVLAGLSKDYVCATVNEEGRIVGFSTMPRQLPS